jgi:hypothetical protein
MAGTTIDGVGGEVVPAVDVVRAVEAVPAVVAERPGMADDEPQAVTITPSPMAMAPRPRRPWGLMEPSIGPSNCSGSGPARVAGPAIRQGRSRDAPVS